MNKFATIAGLAIAATAMNASAEVLLLVDLSVVDQVTISATDGLSSGDVSGTDSTGVLMADFFTGAGIGIIDSLGAGDLTTAGNTSDGTPGIFNSTGSLGFNFWTWTDDTAISFSAGSVAFTGSATWSLDSDEYAAAIAGNTFGDIYAFADTDDDIAASTLIGQWSVVPAPGSLALLGLGGIAAGRRRR